MAVQEHQRVDQAVKRCLELGKDRNQRVSSIFVAGRIDVPREMGSAQHGGVVPVITQDEKRLAGERCCIVFVLHITRHRK